MNRLLHLPQTQAKNKPALNTAATNPKVKYKIPSSKP
jgi:hypothetical protein